jgi:protoporphyrin/coproporphyrin ferrochelatase
VGSTDSATRNAANDAGAPGQPRPRAPPAAAAGRIEVVTTPHADPADRADLSPYDTVLLLSFGGPEQPDDVLPFLRNVTGGRGIPDERLEQVAEHYHHFGGRSPINEQNRALLAAVRSELSRRGVDVPVVWGNRNWAPFVTDTLREAHEAGARSVVTLTTSAFSSYSSCRQYREDLAGALTTLAGEGRRLEVDKIRQYCNHPAFVEPNVRAALEAVRRLPAGSHLVFVTHSVPDAMDDASGPGGDLSPAYSAQHRDVASVVADAVGRELGHAVPWELVYCSRSGPPSQPWLEPDVGDHLRALRDAGVPGAAVCPIGFVSDHLEVKYDLDTEAREVADEIGLPFERAATVGTDPQFVAGLVALLLERAAQARGEQPPQPVLGSRPPVQSVCPPGCCRNLRADRPAACGSDFEAPPLAAR